MFCKQKKEWNKSDTLFSTKYSPKSSFFPFFSLSSRLQNQPLLSGDFISMCKTYCKKTCPLGKYYLLLAICECYWKMTFYYQNINVLISRKNLKSKPRMKMGYHFSLHSMDMDASSCLYNSLFYMHLEPYYMITRSHYVS